MNKKKNHVITLSLNIKYILIFLCHFSVYFWWYLCGIWTKLWKKTSKFICWHWNSIHSFTRTFILRNECWILSKFQLFYVSSLTLCSKHASTASTFRKYRPYFHCSSVQLIQQRLSRTSRAPQTPLCGHWALRYTRHTLTLEIHLKRIAWDRLLKSYIRNLAQNVSQIILISLMSLDSSIPISRYSFPFSSPQFVSKIIYG